MRRRPGITELTDRERQIIALVALGYSNRDIGVLLYIAPETVKSHLKDVFFRLGARTRTECVYRAFQEGWLTITSREPRKSPFLRLTDGRELEWSGEPESLLRLLSRD